MLGLTCLCRHWVPVTHGLLGGVLGWSRMFSLDLLQRCVQMKPRERRRPEKAGTSLGRALGGFSMGPASSSDPRLAAAPQPLQCRLSVSISHIPGGAPPRAVLLLLEELRELLSGCLPLLLRLVNASRLFPPLLPWKPSRNLGLCSPPSCCFSQG